MGEKICVTNELLILLGVSILALIWVTYQQNNKKPNCPPCNNSCPALAASTTSNSVSQPQKETTVATRTDYVNIGDPVKEYDRRKYYDPLENPVRRTDRHNIPPYYLKRMLDLPTRGYPDNFHAMGVLTHVSGTEEESSMVDSNNRIIKLFGRKKYPRGDKHEYYTMLNMGNDTVKIPLNDRYNKELYDDDVVTVKEMGGAQYKVQLYKDDTYRYYPDIF